MLDKNFDFFVVEKPVNRLYVVCINVYENKCAADLCVDLRRLITSNHSFNVCAKMYKNALSLLLEGEGVAGGDG